MNKFLVILLDAIPEEFGTAVSLVFVLIPIIVLCVLIYRFIKKRKQNKQ